MSLSQGGRNRKALMPKPFLQALTFYFKRGALLEISVDTLPTRTGSVVVYQKFNGFTQYKLLEAKLRTGNEIPSHLVEALHKTEKKEKDGRRKRE